jgi:hypothetical protein
VSAASVTPNGVTSNGVTSNGVEIPFSPTYFTPMRETSLDASDAELQARYRDDGYVLLRGLLSPDAVRELRTAYDVAFAAARARGDLPRHGSAGHPAYEFVRGPSFRAFVEQPAYAKIAARMIGAAFAPIRRTPLRHFLPGTTAASRAHIDGTYITGGPMDVVTMWTPFGDCTARGGSLMYLEGSHRDNLSENVRKDAPLDRGDKRQITHDLKWLAETAGRRWLYADFKAGDVVAHSPFIIHATLDAAAHERLSADVRYRRVGSPPDPRWDSDWSADDGY